LGLFDLNISCNLFDEVQVDLGLAKEPDAASHDRAANIPGSTDGRLNLEAKEQYGHRPRGMARFVAPLKKSLLCNTIPMTRTASATRKRGETSVAKHMEKCKARGLHSGKLGLSVDEQATTLLLQATRGFSIDVGRMERAAD
jgi:hypothetical protein